MRSGNWRETGDPIRFLEDGTLADGQHRLAACVKANIPIRVTVVSGLSRDDMLAVDRGRVRSIGDGLTIAHGVPSGARTAAAIRSAFCYAYGVASTSTTPSEVDKFYMAHTGIVDSIRAAGQIGSGLGDSSAAALHYIAHWLGHGERADAMFHVFKTGVPDYPDCPAHLYRERMLRDRARRTPVGRARQMDLLATAWRHFLRRRPTKVVKPNDNLTIDGWTPASLFAATKPL